MSEAIFDDESKKSKWVPKIEMHILAGAQIRAGERIIYPIIKLFVIAAGGCLLGLRISPVALLIVEPGVQYAFSLEGKKMNLEEIYKLDASLKDIIAAASP